MKLHDYQVEASRFIRSHPRCALWMSVGLGKTASTLSAIMWFKGKVLIVAPKRVVEAVWEQESIKWSFGFTFSRILGTPKQRLAALSKDADTYLINYDNLVWLRNHYDKKWPFANVVFDESSMLKTPGSKRSRAALWISNRKNVKRIVQLTATPAANGLKNIYMPIKILDGGTRLGSSMAKYLMTHFYATNPWSDYPVFEVKDGHDAIIHEKLSDIVLSLSSADYLTMPDLITNDVYVDLPKPQREAYDEMKRHMLAKIEDEELYASSAAVLVGKLAQLSSGAVYADGKVLTLHTAKMDALADIIEESSGAPILVGYVYKHSLARMRERFDIVDIGDRDTADIVDDWNAGRIPVLTAQYQAASHGLNLQKQNIMVKFDVTYDLELDAQFTGRLHRQGQEEPVIMHRLIGLGTIDEVIIQSLSDKSSIQNILTEGLKS